MARKFHLEYNKVFRLRLQSTIFFPSKNANKSSKKPVEALMAIRFLSLLLESSLVELFQAERADKMLRMEFAKHGRDAPARNGFGASGTQ